jgi:hypothetical protein
MNIIKKYKVKLDKMFMFKTYTEIINNKASGRTCVYIPISKMSNLLQTLNFPSAQLFGES